MIERNKQYSIPSVEYDSEKGIYRSYYDWSSELPLTTVLIELITDIEGITAKEPTIIDPIYTVIDPEGLNTLFTPIEESKQRHSGKINFTFYGYEITVHATGTIMLIPDSS